MENSRPETVVVLMRHGERIDKAPKEAEEREGEWNIKDPIITHAGEQMAFDLGKLLKEKYTPELEEILGGKFDHVIVQASPYLRTMMTTANLCRGLGIGHFTCNYMFCEW